MTVFRWAVICLCLAPGIARASHDLCLRAVAFAAREANVPREVLLALARTETGRGATGDPWPWSINREGDGHVFASRAEALHFAEESRRAGRISFDLGCFQVNYRWHGAQFASLEKMIDPRNNALYAAQFLRRLYQETGSWADAAAAYHSRTPQYADVYRAKFQAQLAQIDTAPRVAPNRFPLLIASNGTAAPGSLVMLEQR